MARKFKKNYRRRRASRGSKMAKRMHGMQRIPRNLTLKDATKFIIEFSESLTSSVTSGIVIYKYLLNSIY